MSEYHRTSSPLDCLPPSGSCAYLPCRNYDHRSGWLCRNCFGDLPGSIRRHLTAVRNAHTRSVILKRAIEALNARGIGEGRFRTPQPRYAPTTTLQLPRLPDEPDGTPPQA